MRWPSCCLIADFSTSHFSLFIPLYIFEGQKIVIFQSFDLVIGMNAIYWLDPLTFCLVGFMIDLDS